MKKNQVEDDVHKVGGDLCPGCGSHLQEAIPMLKKGGRGPREGDYTMCTRCGTVLIFNKDLSHRKPTAEEVKKIADSPRNAGVMAMAMAIVRARNKPQDN